MCRSGSARFFWWRGCRQPTGERLPWKADPGGLVLFTIFVATTLLALEQVQHVELSSLPLGGMMLLIGIDRAGAAGAA